MTEQNGAKARPIPEKWILTPDELAVTSVVARYAADGVVPPRGAMEEAAPNRITLRWGSYPEIAREGLIKIVRKNKHGVQLEDAEAQILQQIKEGFDNDTTYRLRDHQKPRRGLGVFVRIWSQNLPVH